MSSDHLPVAEASLEMSLPYTPAEIRDWLALAFSNSIGGSPPSDDTRPLVLGELERLQGEVPAAVLARILESAIVESSIKSQQFPSPEAQAQFVTSLLPTTWKIQLGDLGEAVALAVLEHLVGLWIPVAKLQLHQTRNETQHGIDHVGLLIDSSGTLKSIWFVECKARTAMDSSEGVKACAELVEQRKKSSNQVVNFVYHRIAEVNDSVAAQFFRYLVGGSDAPPCSEERGIFLMGDQSAWSTATIPNLQSCQNCDRRDTDCNCSRHAFLLKQVNLRDSVIQIYHELGIEINPDDTD